MISGSSLRPLVSDSNESASNLQQFDHTCEILVTVYKALQTRVEARGRYESKYHTLESGLTNLTRRIVGDIAHFNDFINTRLRAVLGHQYVLFTHRNTRNHLTYIMENNKGEARGRNKHTSNSKIVRNREEKNLGKRRRVLNKVFYNAKEPTTLLPEGHESPYH